MPLDGACWRDSPTLPGATSGFGDILPGDGPGGEDPSARAGELARRTPRAALIAKIKDAAFIGFRLEWFMSVPSTNRIGSMLSMCMNARLEETERAPEDLDNSRFGGP